MRLRTVVGGLVVVVDGKKERKEGEKIVDSAVGPNCPLVF